MCEGQNENIRMVWKYLKGYQDALAYIRSRKAYIADIEKELAEEAAPKSPTLSLAGGCGGGEKQSVEEAAYFKRERMEAELVEMKQELRQLQRDTERITQALETLGDDDRTLIKMRIWHNDSWILIASDLQISPSTARRRLHEVIQILANRIFGPADFPVPTRLSL